MEQATVTLDDATALPVLYIPKSCTMLETCCEATDNVFIDLKISSPDTEGNEMCIYSGFCNVKVIDECEENAPAALTFDNEVVVEAENQITYPPPFNQSQVWIDPVRSPYVYNQFDAIETQEFSISETRTEQSITVEHHNTYITQNVFNYSDYIRYSPAEEYESKKYRKVRKYSTDSSDSDFNYYDDDEFECGVLLTNLADEINNKAQDEGKYVGIQSENSALKQLMSTEIQSVSKQRKTILFLGHDSHRGQTIQKILVNDPNLVCSAASDWKKEDFGDKKSNKKKYQCDRCKQIFNKISAFRQHMVGNHRSPASSNSNDADESSSSLLSEVKFMCSECGKSLKNQEKFEQHCMGHGNPELECNKCRKVFASKFTLRTHRKLHNRKHPCQHCTKTFSSAAELRSHCAKVHDKFMCEHCDFVANKYNELTLHLIKHKNKPIEKRESESSTSSFMDDEMSEAVMAIQPYETDYKIESDSSLESTNDSNDKIKEAESVIAKVISSKVFLLNAKKSRRRYNKKCVVCEKVFDRMGDLKRHLIEHVIRSTLDKTPVSKLGTLKIKCEVCRNHFFGKVDRYKAHLREHASLTLYKCTLCDKTFSDSSNFSKHKKVHGTTYFQCDLCHRKFNSKKMLIQHMEYHNRNPPIKCRYCDKYFYFESQLNKHVKSVHVRETFNKFRCRFCRFYFRTLKEKWEHEWSVHNIRKMIVDCLVCGTQFRKYCELKRHCWDNHDLEIPTAKKLLKRKRKWFRKLKSGRY